MQNNALHEEFVGHGVTHAMWMHPFLDTGASSIADKHLTNHRLGHPPALLGAEERNTERGSEPLPANLNPALDHGRCPRVDPDGPSLIALSVKDRNGTDIEIDVFGFEGEYLAHPEPGAVHDRDEGAVPDPGGRGLALVEDGENFLWREDLSREREPFLRRHSFLAGSRECACGSHGYTVCRVCDTSADILCTINML